MDPSSLVNTKLLITFVLLNDSGAFPRGVNFDGKSN